MWRQKNLTLERNIIIFKTLALSKLVLLAQFLPISNTITARRVTRGGRGVALPYPFSKIGKKYPNFGKKCPDYGHLWVKFLI